MTNKLLVPALLTALLAGCVSAPPVDMSWVPQARSVSTAVPPKLIAVLQEEIARGGPEGAIAACRDQAPAPGPRRVGADRLDRAPRQPAQPQPEGCSRRLGACCAGGLRPSRRRQGVAGDAGTGRGHAG